jgi:Gliding motility associated protein GldN
MKNLFCPLFLLFSYTSTAQFADLMTNKNVAWVAASCIDVRLDVLNEQDQTHIFEQTHCNTEGGLAILKYQDTKAVGVSEGTFFFANTLLKALENKELTAYADSLCVQPIDVAALLTRIDTIQQIDPTTYQTRYKIVQSMINYEDIKLFRAYQITYYSTKNNTWNSRTLAIAPLVMHHDEAGNFVAWKPLFWLKVADKKADLNASSITWAVRRWSKDKESSLNLNTAKIHKKIGENVPMVHFLNAVKTNPQLRVYKHSNNWYDKEPLSASDKESVFASIDTIQTIDPVTYETKTKIVRADLDVTTINYVRLVQEWAWDNKRKVLSVRCLGVSPMRDVNNEEGEFLFRTPLFYQRLDD